MSAHLVLRESGGETGGPGGGVATHTGPVAGDRGQDCPASQEDELQGPQTSHHQSHTVTDRNKEKYSHSPHFPPPQEPS